MKFAIFLAGVTIAFGQVKVEFEVASVRGVYFAGVHSANDCRPSGDAKFGAATTGRVQLKCFPITLLLTESYPYPVARIAGFQKTWSIMADINATMPAGTTRDQYREMLRNLLVDRYHLKTHVETRAAETYSLVQDKGGHRLREHSETNAPVTAPRGIPSLGGDGFYVLPANQNWTTTHQSGRAVRLHAVNMSIEDFVESLFSSTQMIISDDTGLTGKYDFQIDFASPRLRIPDEPEIAPPLEAAVERQLGLRMVKKKGPVEFLVIDSVDKTPTEN
jgi:uncharacterized protein (TIGR03435 family)